MKVIENKLYLEDASIVLAKRTHASQILMGYVLSLFPPSWKYHQFIPGNIFSSHCATLQATAPLLVSPASVVIHLQKRTCAENFFPLLCLHMGSEDFGLC